MIAVAAAMLMSFTLSSSPRVALAQAASPEQQLADRFAPIAYLRTQSRSCDRSGEGYFPAPVDVVLGNQAVALKLHVDGHSPAQDPVIKMGPTAQDLAGLGGAYYLDFPGNPRNVGCTYETDFKRFAAVVDAKPTAYTHIVIDQEHDKLILQYWFWYYFNDWNNTHESDWEMIQLLFDTTTVEDALKQTPSLVGYAQHNGGETAKWGDSKLRLDGDRPIVYPAAGSHAAYFGQHQYIGWGENGAGFGCDNTTPPSVRTPLNAVLIPNQPPVAGEFAWISFRGNWGERQPWTFNGPTGPNTNLLWRDPLAGMKEWRSSSLYIPSSRGELGPTATSFFCSASKFGSQLLIKFGTRPRLLVSGTVVVFALVVLLFVIARGALGAAITVYRHHLRTFLAIGAWAIPLGILFNGVALFVQRVPPANWVMKWFNDTSGSRLFTAASIGVFQHAGMVVVIAPPVLQAMKEILAGRTPSVKNSFRDGYKHLGPLVLGLAIVYLSSGVLALALIGIPLAVWLAVRWQFFGQAVILDGAPNGLAAVRQSARSVRGHWLSTLALTLVFQAFGLLPGPVIGVLLLVLGKRSVEFSNALSSIVYAVTVPISLIGLSLAYERFRLLNRRRDDDARERTSSSST